MGCQLTLKQLRTLKDKELLDYFMEHAGYHERNPPESKYSIRPAGYGRALLSGDTAELRKDFFALVRSANA